MIEKYSEYINESNKFFQIKFVFNRYGSSFKINHNDLTIMSFRDYKIIMTLLNKLNLNKRVLSNLEAYYFFERLSDYEFTIQKKDYFTDIFLYSNGSYVNNCITATKNVNIAKLSQICNTILLDPINIDNYYINKITTDNNMYFNIILQKLMSDNVRDKFKYLTDAKDFDLL